MANVSLGPSSLDIIEFETVIRAVFNNWTALQLAIDHGMGGSQQESLKKVSDMVNKISSICFSPRLTDWQDLAFELEDLMDNCFDTILEDESSDEVAHLLWELSRQWLSGDKDGPKNYIAQLKKPVTSKIHGLEMISESAMEIKEEEVCNGGNSKLKNMEDEEGWTVVKRSR